MSLQSLRQAARIQVRDDARNSYYLLDNLVPRLLFVTLESLQDEIQIHDRVDEYSAGTITINIDPNTNSTEDIRRYSCH